MKFELTMEDYTIILNALHYYKKVDKRGNFKQYNDEHINKLRDKMAYQLIPSAQSGNRLWWAEYLYLPLCYYLQ